MGGSIFFLQELYKLYLGENHNNFLIKSNIIVDQASFMPSISSSLLVYCLSPSYIFLTNHSQTLWDLGIMVATPEHRHFGFVFKFLQTERCYGALSC